MIRTLVKHGNSHALIIDKTMMETLGITPESPINVSLREGSVTLQPANVGVGPDRIAQSLTKIRPRYDGMLKRLAE